MKTGFSTIVIIVVLSLFVKALPALSQDIVFAPLPMAQQIKVSREVRPMLSYLEPQLNCRISINYSNDYADILNQFRQGRIDLAFLGPLPYIQLRKKYEYAFPVVRFLNSAGGDTYTCSIITSMDSNLESIKLLKGKKLALTQPSSTCGYLMTSKMLQAAGLSIEDNLYSYTGSHQEVALTVIRGEFDAGGIETDQGHKYAHLGLRFLAQTEPLPGFLLVANGKTLKPNQIEVIRQTLLRLTPLTNQADRQLAKTWGETFRYGAVIATDNDYDVIRRELDGNSMPAKGNY